MYLITEIRMCTCIIQRFDSQLFDNAQTPGRSFSIKGQLTEKGDQYVFELGKYTKQVRSTVIALVTAWPSSEQLVNKEIEHLPMY